VPDARGRGRFLPSPPEDLTGGAATKGNIGRTTWKSCRRCSASAEGREHGVTGCGTGRETPTKVRGARLDGRGARLGPGAGIRRQRGAGLSKDLTGDIPAKVVDSGPASFAGTVQDGMTLAGSGWAPASSRLKGHELQKKRNKIGKARLWAGVGGGRSPIGNAVATRHRCSPGRQRRGRGHAGPGGRRRRPAVLGSPSTRGQNGPKRGQSCRARLDPSCREEDPSHVGRPQWADHHELGWLWGQGAELHLQARSPSNGLRLKYKPCRSSSRPARRVKPGDDPPAGHGPPASRFQETVGRGNGQVGRSAGPPSHIGFKPAASGRRGGFESSPGTEWGGRRRQSPAKTSPRSKEGVCEGGGGGEGLI